NRDPPLRRRIELLPHVLDRLDGRVPGRVHVGRLAHHLCLSEGGWAAECAGRGRRRAEHEKIASFHVCTPLFIVSIPAGPRLRDGLPSCATCVVAAWSLQSVVFVFLVFLPRRSLCRPNRDGKKFVRG